MDGLRVLPNADESLSSRPNPMTGTLASNFLNIELPNTSLSAINIELASDSTLSSGTLCGSSPEPLTISMHVNLSDLSLSSLEPLTSISALSVCRMPSGLSPQKPSQVRRSKTARAKSTNSKRSETLAKNPHTANRYRLRQKDYVEKLQRRCGKEL